MTERAELGAVEQSKGNNEAINIKPKDFVDSLRRKFHDNNKDIKLNQLEKLNSKLNSLSEKIQSIFKGDSQKVFNLLKDVPIQQIENLALYGSEFVEENTKDIMDDINSLDDQKIKYGYMTLALNFFQNKQEQKESTKTNQVATVGEQENNVKGQDNTNKGQDNTNKGQYNHIVEETASKKEDVDKEVNAEDIENNRKLLNEAIENKEAVQKDPSIAKHFNTTEFKQRKQLITQQLEARPEFKDAVKTKFGKDVPSADLADLVITKQIIQENNLSTPSTASFVKSYNTLDNMLRFGSYSAGEFGKNDNILYNKSYSNIIDKQGTSAPIIQDSSRPEVNAKAMDILKNSKPGLVTDEFLNKYKTATMSKNGDELKKLQNENPEAFAEIQKVQNIINNFLTKSARVESIKAYNGYIGGLFGSLINGKDGGNIVTIKTSDDKLKLTENGIELEFQVQGTDCRFEIKDGKAYMTNLLNKNDKNKQFKIQNDEIPLPGGVKIPSISDVINEVSATIQQEGAVDLLENVHSLEDLANNYSDIQEKMAKKVDSVMEKLTKNAKKEELSKSISEYAEKHYCTTKLLSKFVPPQYDYIFQNKNSPVVGGSDKTKSRFYNFLDVLRNTFQDTSKHVPASKMSYITNKLEYLFDNKIVDPEEFFSKFDKGKIENSEFIDKIPGTDDSCINLDKFDAYLKQFK